MGFERIVPGTKEWDAYHGNHLARYRFAVETLRLLAPAKILDAATGVGYGTNQLATSLNAKLVGVDRSDEALAVARSQFAHPSITFVKDDCHTLEEAAKHGPFDAVVSMETFEHLPKPMDFLASVRKVLKPGGTFLVSTPNKDEFSNAGEWEFHEKEYTPAEFHQMLVEAGFQNIRLLGQRFTDRGRDREEIRAELNRIHQNPFMRLGRWMQRTFRGRTTETAILPERPEDFEFAPIVGDLAAAGAGNGSFVLLGAVVR
jgi:cyclopropane fatty-acyl-phospholipid synthase-like methyltransferase